MNATTAMAMALLQGRVISIKTGFKEFGVTNVPREVSRSIEKKFGVRLARVQKEGKSKWKVPCWWYEYRLPTTDYNKEGREKMIEYVKKNTPKMEDATTQEELNTAKKCKQLNLL